MHTLQIDTSDTSAPRESEARIAVISDALFARLWITPHDTVIPIGSNWHVVQVQVSLDSLLGSM